MIYSPTIAASSGQATIDIFQGLNRRVKTEPGEFADMENICFDEFPCLHSAKGPFKTQFALPSDVEAVKMIIPKRLEGQISGFSGVVYNRTLDCHEIYINGTMKLSGIKEYTDAVDYNGTIIVLPELKGVSYATKTETGDPSIIESYSLTRNIAFYNNYLTDDASSMVTEIQIVCSLIEYQRFIESKFEIGEEIVISKLEGDFEVNNSIFPDSSTDYSNTTSPVSIKIVSMSRSGGANTSLIRIQVELKNAKGEIIGWPKGKGNKDYSDGPTDYTLGTISKKLPKSTYGCVAHNRLWLCSYTGEEVVASALGQPLLFYEFDNIDTDSWSGTVGTPGKFTGIAAWQNRMVLFKPDIIHIIYGDLPSTFGIEKTYSAGCIDPASIATVGGRLIWLYYDGFYTYSGGIPKKISHKLKTPYVSCKAFSDGVRYWARCMTQDGNSEFLIYDSELNMWSKYTDMDIVSGDYWGGKIYVCDKQNIYILSQGDYGDFYAETPELTFGSFQDKSIMYLTVRCKIQNGFLNIYTSANKGAWVSHKGISESGKLRFPVRYAPGDTIRLRFEGRGNICITEINPEILIKKR